MYESILKYEEIKNFNSVEESLSEKIIIRMNTSSDEFNEPECVIRN